MSLAATAVCFAGLTRGGVGVRLSDTLDGAAFACGTSLVATQGRDVCGEIGVGGGARGPSLLLSDGDRSVEDTSASSFSVSEPDDSTSSSQESAIGTASFFGFVGPLIIGRGTSFSGLLFVRLRSWRQDSNSDSSFSVPVTNRSSSQLMFLYTCLSIHGH